MVQCLTVDRPIAISSANCQLLLDCIKEAKNCWKGNLPGLFFYYLLQPWDWSCLPSNFINSLFKLGDGALRHLPTCFKVIFLEAGYAVNCHKYIRFLRIAIIPFIRQHHGSGCYWLWMDLASAHYANNMLTFLQQQGFIPKLYSQGCKPTMRGLAPAGRILAQAQKYFLQLRREATSIPALKRNIKKAQQIPLPTILFKTVKVQLAVCTWNGYWAVYRWALNHALLGTNLPHNIDKSTYFCLWINKFILLL